MLAAPHPPVTPAPTSAAPPTERQALLAALPGRPRLVLVAPPHSLEWHEARRLGLGGSDVAAALGFDDYRAPYEVWASKRGLTGPGDTSEPAAWGQRLEPVVGAWAAAELGAVQVPTPGILAHRDHPRFLGNLDGFLLGAPAVDHPAVPDGQLAVLECKVSRWAERWADGDLPARAEVQARWYLAITGLEVAWVAALLHGTRGELRRVVRNERVERFLLGEAARFWELVERGDPPAPGPSERVGRLLRQVPVEPGATVDLGEEWRERLAEHRRLAAQAKAAAEALEASRNALAAELGSAEAAYLNGAEVATFRPVTSRRLDGKRLAAEHPELAERYRTETTSRRLVVAGEEEDA
jgi:putative phage-type endonuclease